MTLNVSELFYSIQGEGARTGCPSIFIRLQGCSAKFACFESGVRCDTEFESGDPMQVSTLVEFLQRPDFGGCKWIVWTGGEPLDQLTPEIVQMFRDVGFKQAVETSGIKPMLTQMFDWVTLSPKVAEHVLRKHFPLPLYHGDYGSQFHVHELKYVRHTGQSIPQPALTALHYYLQPHAESGGPTRETINHCKRLCLDHPQWALSMQTHKLLGVL